jgi:hypothetical protein
VSKNVAARTAIALALCTLIAPTTRAYSLAPGSTTPPTIITGGDPQPIGQISSVWTVILPVLVALVSA